MTSISLITLLFGALLTIVGLSGFFGTGASHPMMLFPSLPGLLLLLCGLLARKEKLHDQSIKGAFLIALLGFGANVSSFASFQQIVMHGTANNGSAALVRMATSFLCGVFIARCIQSFFEARRSKKQG